MSKKRIAGLIVYLSIVMFTAQSLLSQQSNFNDTVSPPDDETLNKMTPEERRKTLKEWHAQRERRFKQRVEQHEAQRMARLRDSLDGKNESRNQSIKKILEVTEERWKLIEPKIIRISYLKQQSRVSIGLIAARAGGYSSSDAVSSGNSNGSSVTEHKTDDSNEKQKGGYSTQSNSEDNAQFNWCEPIWRLVEGRDITESEKACEELFETVQDKNSSMETIRQKMEVLRLAKKNTDNQLVKVRQQLRELLTPRQEAILIIMGILD